MTDLERNFCGRLIYCMCCTEDSLHNELMECTPDIIGALCDYVNVEVDDTYRRSYCWFIEILLEYRSKL